MAPFEPLAFQTQTVMSSAVPTLTHSRWQNLPWVGLAILLHVALFGSFAFLPAPVLIELPVPFAAEIISAASPEKKVDTPKPQPKVERKPAPTPPIPVSKIPTPTALTTQAQPTAPTPPAEAAPAAKSAADSAAAAPAAVVQPRFDAAYLNNPAPTYPPMSRRLGETGRVFLRVHVLPAGTPDQVEVRTGSGFPRLDNAAVDAVKRWRFVPAKQGSELVAAWVIVPISFSLEN
ncbi:MAG TPA: TonB family protein [Rhodocyclaceae bacterium]|jgi:protein TonB|nr:TonB family protein [Rhodocyclaceae bacterium]